MDRERVLVAYYSMTGNTERLAREIQSALGPAAALERIRELRERRGTPGVLHAMLEVIFHRRPALLPPHLMPADHDLLVLGGPIWVGRMAPPLRTYAGMYGTPAPRLALFCTEGGSNPTAAFAEIGRICGRAPVATLAVDGKHLLPPQHAHALERFVAALQRPPSPR